MSFEVAAPLDLPPGTVVAPAAVAGLVGRRPTVNGRVGEVTAAWVDGDGRVLVRLRVDGPTPDWLVDGSVLEDRWWEA